MTRFIDYLAGAHQAIAIGVVLIGLVAWIVTQEARLTELVHQQALTAQHVDDLDNRGSRALADRFGPLIQRVNSVEDRAEKEHNNLAERITAGDVATNGRIDELQNRLSLWIVDLKKIEVIEEREKECSRRLDQLERQLK
jgi:hypothetical protein